MRRDELEWRALYLEDEVVAFVSTYKLLVDDMSQKMYKRRVY